MSNITTKYLGMTLKSPIIVGSCGLTRSPEKVQELEQNGAGAVVLKSIFEEEIAFEYQDVLQQASPGAYNLEAFDYYDQQVKGEHLSEYIKLIQDCKRKVSIPVIASVNCAYSHEWSIFAQRLAGCRSGRDRTQYVLSALGPQAHQPGAQAALL